MTNTRLRWTVSTVSLIAVVSLCGSGMAATRLEWKLAKGKTYYHRTVVNQQISQTMMEQEQKTEQVIGVGQKLQVLDVDAQGNMRIQYTFLWTRLKQVNPMVQVDYDSSAQSPVPAGAEGFAALVGQGYTARLTPQGKVLDVNGVEQVRDAVLKKLPAGEDPAQTMNPVAMYINPTSVKQMIESNAAIYPDRSVSPGDSWTREMSISMGFKMIIQSKWTLQKEEAGIATITSASSLRADPSGPPMEAFGMKFKGDLAGTQEGTLQVAEATGVVMAAKSRQQLKGKIETLSTPDQPPMMVMPTTIDAQTTGEMSEQMWKTDQP